MRHILSVDVVPTQDVNILHLFDTSRYADGLGKNCATLEVTIPGFTDIRVIETNPFFNIAFDSISLQISAANATERSALPDGLYKIRYSVSPNDSVYTEQYYLRTTNFDNLMFELRCKVKLSTCSPESGVLNRLEDLDLIDNFMKSAIAKVDYCDQISQGLDLFGYAYQLLEKQFNFC